MSRTTNLSARWLTGVVAALSLPVTAGAHGVDFPTSCLDSADAAFDEGLGLLHNMMYIQAEAAFATAAAKDPNCAMAQWGIAMANFHPLWPGVPTDEETARGSAAAARLADLSPDTELERDLAAAAMAFYTAGADGYRSRIGAWAKAQNAAYEAHHDNIDAAALALLARLSTAAPGPEGGAERAAAGDLLDQLHQTAPHHPGVIHYAIHAYDSPPLKDRGVPYAEVYDKIAPAAAHALHMPSHIFTRSGDWKASVDLNRRSAEAALAVSGDVVQSDYVHAIDYMVYAYLQLGEADKARDLVREMLDRPRHQVSFGGAFGLAASPVRLVLEQDDWAGASALSTELHPSIPWEAFPQATAMLWFAKGVGAARSGDIDSGRVAVGELTALRQAMLDKDQGYWARLSEGQIISVEAWIELAQGQQDLALKLQTTAADLEDELGKSPVTPGHVLPARELLGDMYAEIGQDEMAAEAYRQTLTDSPGRARSISALK